MDVEALRGPVRYLAQVEDPRADNVTYRLIDLLLIVLMAVLCRAEDYEEIADWAEQRADWLATFLHLPKGTPCAMTFERILRRINPQALEQALVAMTGELAQATEGRLIAIDGKSLRGSFDHAGRKSPIHMVQAWDRDNGLVLGQLATDEKSNEITAVATLLELLDVRGAVLTLDAMHCQKQTAEQIVRKKADYILAVKKNQKSLHEDVKLFCDEASEHNFDGVSHVHTEQVDAGHDRLEVRRLWATDDVAWLKQQGHDWKGLKGIVCVEAQRTTFANGKTTTTRRYFITSLNPTQLGADKLLDLIRGHWSIENTLHWTLDVTFREDACRVRKDHGPQNIARLRRLSAVLLRRTPPKTRSGRHVAIKRRRLIASVNDEYLLRVIMGA